MSTAESSSSAGAVTGGSETAGLAVAAICSAVRPGRLLDRTFVELLRMGRRSAWAGRTEVAAVAVGVRESLATACRETATGAGAAATRSAPGWSARRFAVQPNAIAATMLAAHAARWARRRRAETSTAARRLRVSNGVGKDRGGASRASRAVVRSRSAAIPSRAPWHEAQAARWLSISTHWERLSPWSR